MTEAIVFDPHVSNAILAIFLAIVGLICYVVVQDISR